MLISWIKHNCKPLLSVDRSSEKVFGSNSGWLFTDAADSLFVVSIISDHFWVLVLLANFLHLHYVKSGFPKEHLFGMLVHSFATVSTCISIFLLLQYVVLLYCYVGRMLRRDCTNKSVITWKLWKPILHPPTRVWHLVRYCIIFKSH